MEISAAEVHPLTGLQQARFTHCAGRRWAFAFHL